MDGNPGISLLKAATINIENVLQNQEEAENLEDQKRHQAEIQNLLTKAMDEFNYDEQSTINSSTNVSINESYPAAFNNFEEKYKNASYDDQLKVLYEVRVREVKGLTEQLENMKTEFVKEKEASGKKILLLEAENNKILMSLTQSQALIVCKTEEITAINHELSQVNTKVKQLEETLKKVTEEKETCESLNKDLLNQLSVMHTGISTNTISSKQILEQQQAEISQLHAMLESANMKIERKEKEYYKLQQNFKEKCTEKDEIVTEKCAIINKLTESLENAQQQCQELLEIIEKISQENRSMKLASSRNELTDSIKIMDLADKTEMVKALQKELEKTREIQHKQQAEFQKLQATCVQLSENFSAAEHEIEYYKSEIAIWTKKNKSLEKELEKCNNELQDVAEQLTKYKNASVEKSSIRVEDIPSKLLEDQSIQVSNLFSEDCEKEKEKNEALKRDLETAYKNIEMLKNQLSAADDQVSTLSKTVSLEIERDKLIKTLQEKAAQFERIIIEKQTRPQCNSVGINTDQEEKQQTYEILQAKFEADLIQKEIQLRTELQKAYDAKLLNLENKHFKIAMNQENESCNRCVELMKEIQDQKFLINTCNEELNLLRFQRQQDRDAVANLVEDWRDKLISLESQNKELHSKYLDVKNYSEELALKLKTREAGDGKLYTIIKRECEDTIKEWNKQVMAQMEKYCLSQKIRFQQTQQRIDNYTDHCNKEVYEIEMKFLHKKQAVEQLIKK